MKKLYTIAILLLSIPAIGFAQCTISNATVTPSGLTVNASTTASGAGFAGYGWDWGDATTPTAGVSSTASHTYAAAGTYTVCAYYVDATDTSCHDQVCQSVTVAAVGIQDPTAGTNSISTSPNPFSTTTTFSVTLKENADVEISVYDVTGKKVETVQDGEMNAGTTKVIWTPENLADGVYFVQMTIDGSVITKRIVHTSGN